MGILGALRNLLYVKPGNMWIIVHFPRFFLRFRCR